MRKPRHLSAEERALWQSVAQRTKPLTSEKKTKAKPMPQLSGTKKAEKPTEDVADPISAFRLGEKAPLKSGGHSLAPALAEGLVNVPLQMDSKQHGRMKRGKLSPEARIDLHGMTLAEAHPALISFIMGAQTDGLRLVLVITGKGKDRDTGGPIPTRFGVLRHQVPQWLQLPPLRSAVLQVTPAHIRHGGGGAYYVYLRRVR